MFSISKNRSADNSSIDALKTLPYVAWTPAGETITKKGVIKYDPEKSFKGINIWTSVGASKTHLIDMRGNIVHRWSTNEPDFKWLEAVQVCKNGDFLGIVKDKMLVRLDWDSNIKWTKKIRCHHEITLDENNDIYVLTRKDDVIFIKGLPVPVLNDYITVVSPDGRIKSRIELLNSLRKNLTLQKVLKIYHLILNPTNWKKTLVSKRKHGYITRHGTALDVFHNNTITIIDRDIDNICKAGDLLICARELDLVAILDAETNQLLWSWGPGQLSGPHHPTVLQNGNILIFDNGRTRKSSRVIEIEPKTKKIVWEHKAAPSKDFYSGLRGAAQRLPNGNTLITESDKGHVFEITADGQLVWEFYNPDINIETKERAVIYRMMRITDPQSYPHLDKLY